MFSKQLLAGLSLIMLFSMYAARRPKYDIPLEKKPCVDEPPSWNFIPAKFSGRFYLTASDDPSRLNLECLQYLILESREEGIFPLVELYREKSDSSTHMVLRDLMLNSTGCGINNRNQPFTIAHISYEEYLIAFTCDQSTDRGFATLLTRKQDPQYEDIYEADVLLKPNNRGLHTLKFMKQRGCPEDWSDAQVEETDFTYAEVEDELIANDITKAKE